MGTAVLGVDHFFSGIYGAIDDDETHSIASIIQENNLHGSELLVVGDDPVEIRQGRANGAVTLGIAANERQRFGFDSRKHQRLLNAGADLIVADFKEYKGLVDLFVRNGDTDVEEHG